MKTFLSVCVGFLFCVSTSASAWTYQEVRSILEKDPTIRTVEDFLPRLDSELLANYLLLHNSNSLQRSTLDAPRVILFSDDGMFMLAFNGGGSLPGADRIEMIQFNPNDKKFEFYDATFPKSADQNVVFSGKNPAECTSCHRADLRPNWDSYPFWKDAYGSIEGSDTLRVDMFPETKLFKSFQEHAKQNERYKQLQGLQSQTVERQAKRNLDFNRAVGYRNFQRIAANLKASPDYDKYKYAFFGAIRKCDVNTFLPADVQITFANNVDFYINQAQAFDRKLQQERGSYVKRTETFYEPKVIGSLRYLLEGRRVNAGAWSMVLGEETYSLSTGSYGVIELGPMILAQSPELKGMDCKDLKKKSLIAFGGTSFFESEAQ